jgi:hypothetical protein
MIHSKTSCLGIMNETEHIGVGDSHKGPLIMGEITPFRK